MSPAVIQPANCAGPGPLVGARTYNGPADECSKAAEKGEPDRKPDGIPEVLFAPTREDEETP